MFTGIVEELGRVEQPGSRLSIACTRVLDDLTIGASIAVNGVCLTAVDIRTDGFSADLAPETLDRSNLGDLKFGDGVNLERPITLAARLSGHIMQGHVDGTGLIQSLAERGDGNWELINCACRRIWIGSWRLQRLAIASDDVSLMTIASVRDSLVKVAIIPHTRTGRRIFPCERRGSA